MHRKGYILVVETDDLIRKLLERWLTEAGYRTVAGAFDAPRTEGEPCLVIANVPNPVGAQAQIRSLIDVHQAPILALSARFRRGLGESPGAARHLGVRNVVPKPFTREELLDAVRESLR